MTGSYIQILTKSLNDGRPVISAHTNSGGNAENGSKPKSLLRSLLSTAHSCAHLSIFGIRIFHGMAEVTFQRTRERCCFNFLPSFVKQMWYTQLFRSFRMLRRIGQEMVFVKSLHAVLVSFINPCLLRFAIPVIFYWFHRGPFLAWQGPVSTSVNSPCQTATGVATFLGIWAKCLFFGDQMATMNPLY